MDLNLEQAFDEPVAFRGRLEKADKGFHLSGEIRIAGAVSCARCLKDVPFRKTAQVSWTLAPVHERPNAAELELEAGDLDVVWYDELVVPLEPLIDEQLQLELPMKPLCSDDCKGLCAQCGVDLNTGTCTCAAPADDRWAALKSLRP